MTDPFGGPAVIPTEFATIESFRGRLVLIKPTKLETGLPNQMNPGQLQDRMTADVSVVDGRGPVQQFKNRQPTGQILAGPEFPGTWFSQDRVVKQLMDAYKNGTMVLGVLETYKPGQQAIKGNPWGIVEATEEQKQLARNYLANRTIGNATAPAAAPQYPAQPQQTYAATPAPTQAYAAPQGQPPAVTGQNQFAAAPAPGKNPFLSQ